jgi:glycosyltransferase involved in cell wall biosynthesis
MGKTSWEDFRTYLPLWVSVFRWGMFMILRLLPVLFYRVIRAPKKARGNVEEGSRLYTKDDITAIIPVYQPPPSFMKTIESLVSNGVPIILVVADITCLEKVTDMTKHLPQVVIIPETAPGKRSAMATGLRHVTSRLTFFVDDDIQWCDTACEYLLNAFNHDEKIKGVGCAHTARKEGWCDVQMIMADMRLSIRTLELLATSVADRGASCISGRTACYVTDFLQEDQFYEEFLNEQFLGLRVVSGDDKFLTRYVMKKGGKIWHQAGSKCVLSTSFERGPKFFKQLLRWSRNTWRSDITCLFIERKVWFNNPFTAIVMFDKMVTPFFLIYGLFYIPIQAIVTKQLTLFVGWLVWLIVSRSLRIIYYLVFNPWHVIFIPFFIMFQYVQAVVRIWALLTLYERGWGTRDITFKGNTIERGNAEDDDKNEVEAQNADAPVEVTPIHLVDVPLTPIPQAKTPEAKTPEAKTPEAYYKDKLAEKMG